MKNQIIFSTLFFILFVGIVAGATFNITKIDIPDKLNTASNYQINVSISITDPADVVVKTYPKGITLSPDIQNVGLVKGENNIKFNILTYSQEQVGELTVEVCGVSQFTEASCMNKSKSFMIVEEKKIDYTWMIYVTIFIFVVVILFLLLKKSRK